MLTLLLVTLLSVAQPADGAQADGDAPATSTPSDGPHGWKCSTGRNRLQTKEARETWDQMKAMKKDNGGGVPPEAQKILNQMTEMYEQDGGKDESDMAELMREFAGGKAARKTAC